MVGGVTLSESSLEASNASCNASSNASSSVSNASATAAAGGRSRPGLPARVAWKPERVEAGAGEGDDDGGSDTAPNDSFDDTLGDAAKGSTADVAASFTSQQASFTQASSSSGVKEVKEGVDSLFRKCDDSHWEARVKGFIGIGALLEDLCKKEEGTQVGVEGEGDIGDNGEDGGADGADGNPSSSSSSSAFASSSTVLGRTVEAVATTHMEHIRERHHKVRAMRDEKGGLNE